MKAEGQNVQINHIGCLVTNVVAGKYAKGVVHEVQRHIAKCGEEWTVSRLKAIWNAALHLRNGDRLKAQASYQSASIAYHKGKMLPKGAFAPVVSAFVSAQKPSTIRRWAAVLRLYTSFYRSGQPTKQQLRKVRKAISGPSLANEEQLGLISKDVLMELDWCLTEDLGPNWKELINADSVMEGRDKYAQGLHGLSKYYSRSKVPKPMRGVPYSSFVWSLMTEPYVPPPLRESTPCLEHRVEIETQVSAGEYSPQHYVGRVLGIQNSGYKWRNAYMLSSYVQLSMKPLHKFLDRFIEKHFSYASCVHNQTKGAYLALQLAAEGKPIFSVDLSAATDRFPRSVSLDILSALNGEKYAWAIEDICQHPFEFPFDGEEAIKMSVGQPMGLYGSFPLFTLSNILIARTAETQALVLDYDMDETKLQCFRDGSSFKVLGDDVIFSDRNVALHYTQKLRDLGVEVSLQKSFEGRVGEFAGFVILPSRDNMIAFRPYKVPNSQTVTNPVDFLHALGARVKRIKRSNYWSKVWDAYSKTSSWRDISLAPLLEGDPRFDWSPGHNQLSSHSAVALATMLATVSSECQPEVDIPSMGESKINRVPLFLEQSVYVESTFGYNPREYREIDRHRRDVYASVPWRLAEDPLLKPLLNEQKERDVSHEQGREGPVQGEIQGLGSQDRPRYQQPKEDLSAPPERQSVPPADFCLTKCSDRVGSPVFGPTASGTEEKEAENGLRGAISEEGPEGDFGRPDQLVKSSARKKKASVRKRTIFSR